MILIRILDFLFRFSVWIFSLDFLFESFAQIFHLNLLSRSVLIVFVCLFEHHHSLASLSFCSLLLHTKHLPDRKHLSARSLASFETNRLHSLLEFPTWILYLNLFDPRVAKIIVHHSGNSTMRLESLCDAYRWSLSFIWNFWAKDTDWILISKWDLESET